MINQFIVNLDLSFNEMNVESCENFATCLIENQSIETLNLSSNSISKKGSEFLSKALEKNQYLKSLNISSNFISVVGISNYLKNNRCLMTLDISG
jgi:Ran GTPase-activating protein (RanGAP) involved in mRNA processing and transport